jgi:hypothetical protein
MEWLPPVGPKSTFGATSLPLSNQSIAAKPSFPFGNENIPFFLASVMVVVVSDYACR